MAFTIFVTNTVADATELMDNFYYLGGDRLPYTGNSLTAIDNTYDLGSSSYKWVDVFCNNFEAPDSIATTESWVYVASETLSATASTIEITGLNYDEMEIYFYAQLNHTSATYMIFNGDSAGSYGYYEYFVDQEPGAPTTFTTTHDIGTNDTRIILLEGLGLDTSTSIYAYAKCHLYARPGQPKVMTFIDVRYSTPTQTSIAFYVEHVRFQTSVWSNGTDTLTTIKIYGQTTNSFDPNTKIVIWGKNI